MNLLDLPIEIGILIIDYLDLKTKINLYNYCISLRKFFAPCHAKTITLSRTCLSVNTLKSRFFLDHLEYIRVLNLNAVRNIEAENLEPLKDNLRNLVSLDISFTSIYLPEFIGICPKNVTKISLNFFKFPKNCLGDRTWVRSQDFFIHQQFEEIHFIVFEFEDSEIPLIFLRNVKMIANLQITVADNYRDFWIDTDEEFNWPLPKHGNRVVNFKKLSYLLRDCKVTHKTSECFKGVANLDFSNLEYIFIMYLERIVIYTSPIFRKMFLMNCSDLRVEINAKLPLDFMLDGNMVFMCWNKLTTVFDEAFLENLKIELKDYFPTYVCMHNKMLMKITDANSDWYCIDSCDEFDMILEDLPSKVTLTDFCRKDGAVLRCNLPVSLQTKSLVNLTFLRLSNIFFNDNFFLILFCKCPKLDTLDLYIEKQRHINISQVYTSLHKSMENANFLKNFKLTTEDVDYSLVFEAVSCCSSMENLHICEYERSFYGHNVSEDIILEMMQKCDQLYSIFVEAEMSPEQLTLLMSPLRECADKCLRDHLSIEVCECYRGWSPFMDVFNPSPLNILD